MHLTISLVLCTLNVHDVTISCDRGWPFCISVRLHPATGDVQEQQYVCLTLELSPPPDVSHSYGSYLYCVVPNRRAVHKCEGLGACLLVARIMIYRFG